MKRERKATTEQQGSLVACVGSSILCCVLTRWMLQMDYKMASLSVARQSKSGLGSLIIQAPRSHKVRHTHPAGPL